MKTFALALCLAAACLAAPDVQELGASTSVATGNDDNTVLTTAGTCSPSDDTCTWKKWTGKQCGAGSAPITVAAADRSTMDDSEENCKSKCEETANCVAFHFWTNANASPPNNGNKCGLASKCYPATGSNRNLHGREAKRGWVGPWSVPSSVTTGTDCDGEATGGCTWRTWTGQKCGGGSAGITIAAADRNQMDDSVADCRNKCDATANCVAFVWYTGSGSPANKCGLASKCYKGTDGNWKLFGREAKRGWVGPWTVPSSV